ncbi:MAG: hypothetical protein GKR89_27930 [Candidatus Latescibacteria bacterium]|nr:hypothetical protein [Candidatus Latescibacterota bacterium]
MRLFPRCIGRLLSVVLPAFLPIHATALETVVIGQGGQLDWRGSGSAAVSAIDAQHRSLLAPNKLLLGNAPGGLIEFASETYPDALLLLKIIEGQNVANGSLERGGSISAPNVFDFGREGATGQNIFDANDLRRALEELIDSSEGGEKLAFERKNFNALGTLVVLNMGGRFGVNRIRFFPRNTAYASPTTPFQNDFMRAFELYTNDGLSLTEGGNPIWEPILLETGNEEPVVEVVLDPPRAIQSVRLRATSNINFEIDEIELFGKGFLSSGQYISDIFDAGEPAVWGKLRWLEEVAGDPTFSSLQIRTRTGTDPAPFVFTRILSGKRDAEEIPFSVDSDEVEMELEEYQSLPQNDSQGRQWNPGTVKDDLINWSPFSTPYPASAANDSAGIPIASPSPRRYFQFQVLFESSDLEATRVLQSLSLDLLTPPLADALTGEIYPRQVPIAEPTSFIFAIRPSVQQTDRNGFDTIEIETPTQVAAIESIEILDSDETIVASRQFASAADTALADGFQILAVAATRFSVRIPFIQDDGALVKVHFRTEVLTYSSDFTASVSLSSEPSIAQPVFAGNAAFLAADDDPDLSSTTVLSPSVLSQARLLDQVELRPSAFSPNGDGINDRVSIRYNLLSVSTPRPVSIEIYDLSGRRLRVIHDGDEITGQYVDKTWDGRDDQNNLVPPGLYIVRLAIEGDSQQDQRTRIVGVAY